MNIKKTKILGSTYIGLFAIANDKLCFAPKSIEEKASKLIEDTLGVKVVKTNIYDSSLLAVFGKMNNKKIFLPSFVSSREIETIEKEIKVEILNTEHALGNLIEINDTHAILSKTLSPKEISVFEKENLKIIQTNIAKTDAVGSAIVITNKGFVINPNATEEEVKNIQGLLNIKGGASTANTGDKLIRNSIIANSKGAIVGELTTGHEMNRIDEALSDEER